MLKFNALSAHKREHQSGPSSLSLSLPLSLSASLSLSHTHYDRHHQLMMLGNDWLDSASAAIMSKAAERSRRKPNVRVPCPPRPTPYFGAPRLSALGSTARSLNHAQEKSAAQPSSLNAARLSKLRLISLREPRAECRAESACSRSAVTASSHSGLSVCKFRWSKLNEIID